MSEAHIQATSWMLVHFLWQAAVVAALLAFVLPRTRFRYLASTTAMLSLVVITVLTFLWQANHPYRFTVANSPFNSSVETPTQQSNGPLPSSIGSADLPMDLSTNAVVASAQSRALDSSLSETHHLHSMPASEMQHRSHFAWQWWLVVSWFTGICFLSVRFVFSWRSVQRLVNQSQSLKEAEWQERVQELTKRLGISRPIKWMTSNFLDVPIVTGYLRPMVIVPTSLLTSMSPDQIDAILLHELAHIRRHDYLVNLFQICVETIFFFHPAVWWISKQMRMHREYCCDDVASRACDDPTAYAWALTVLDQLRGSSQADPALAADGNRPGGLLDRIERLFNEDKRSVRTPLWAFVVITSLMVTSIWSVAMADQEDGPRQTELIREIIGRYDAEYWGEVDVASLSDSKQIALSPNGDWLALVRDNQLYVIESASGEISQQRPMQQANAMVTWASNQTLVVKDQEKLTIPVKRQMLKVVNADGSSVTYNGLVETFVGFPFLPVEYWGSSRDRDGLCSLAGLKQGEHRVVLSPDFPARTVTTIKLPTNKEVVEARLRDFQPWRSTNLSLKATVRDGAGDGQYIRVQIDNRTDQRLVINDHDLRIEVPGPNHGSTWCLSPAWRSELKRTLNEIEIAPGKSGEIEISWRDWIREGLWYEMDNLPVMQTGKVIPNAPAGQIGLRMWVRNFGVLPINVVHPSRALKADELGAKPMRAVDPQNGGIQSALQVAPVPVVNQQQAADAKVVREYVMLRLRNHILNGGKIPTKSINIAIDVVASDGGRDPQVRRIVMDELEKSHADRNGLFVRRRLLKLLEKILEDDGAYRWSYEYQERTGHPSQAVLPPNTVLYADSPLLTRLMKLGRQAERLDIDDYVLALRAAHHPQTVPFLLDVINNPVDGVSPFSDAQKPPQPQGKWPDNVGGNWQDAKFYAAVGLAELGKREGVEWLLKSAKPNDFGLNYELRKQCEMVLAELSGVPVEKGFGQWTIWWNANREKLVPKRVRFPVSNR